MSELDIMVNQINPDLILLTETWLNPCICNAAVNLEGYEIIPDLRKDRQDTAGGVGGGLLVYVKEGLHVVPVESESSFNQHCKFYISTKSGRLEFILIYRPPTTGVDNTEKLCKLMEETGDCVLIGDFNLPGIDWRNERADSKGRHLLNSALENGMEQLVEGATHAKGNTLDLVLTNIADRVIAIQDEGRLGSSDHIMLLVEIETEYVSRVAAHCQHNWWKADFNAIKNDLASVNWIGEMQNLKVQDCWDLFKSKIDEAVLKHVPLSGGGGKDRKKWVNQKIISLIRKKKRLWLQFKKQMSERNKMEYEEAAKEAKYAIRRAKVRL